MSQRLKLSASNEKTILQDDFYAEKIYDEIDNVLVTG